MKIIILISIIVSLSCSTKEVSLYPDEINQIFAKVKTDMEGVEVEKIIQSYYPNCKGTISIWSGQTGYISFYLNSKFTLSFAAYNKPNGIFKGGSIENIFVHPDRIYSINLIEDKTRIDLHFHDYQE